LSAELLNRQSSTLVALSAKRAKFTPLPSHVAPNGYGLPEYTIGYILGLINISGKGFEDFLYKTKFSFFKNQKIS
jgi:hypothetical protein